MYSDFDPIIPLSLYQGSWPPGGDELKNALGFDVVVLCAFENQGESNEYLDIEVVRAPGDDVEQWPIEEGDLNEWKAAARVVAQHVKAGKKVLVTCVAGLNRSGMVIALALHELYGWSGDRCIEHIQSHRADALFRKAFRRHLSAYVREKT